MLAVPPLKLAFMDSAYKENASASGYLIHQRTIDTDSSTMFSFQANPIIFVLEHALTVKLGVLGNVEALMSALTYPFKAGVNLCQLMIIHKHTAYVKDPIAEWLRLWLI